MCEMSVRASDVQPGDKLLNSHAYHPSAAWVIVRSVDTIGGYTRLRTSVYDEWCHPQEGVFINRE
jgi:hypothetical protein